MSAISKNVLMTGFNACINNIEFVILPAMKYLRDEILAGKTWTTVGMTANANSAMYKVALDLYNQLNTQLTNFNTNVKTLLLTGDSWTA